MSDLVPLTLNGMNSSFIMVEAQYTFTPPAGFILKTPQTITSTAYAKPRLSTYIGPTTGTIGYIPPVPNLILVSWSTTINGVTCSVGLL